MALPATDTFTGTDGASIGNNWTMARNGFVIASNQAVGSTDDDCYAYWSADAFAANQYSRATIQGLTANAQYKGMVVRAAGTGASFRGYACYTDGSAGAGHTEIIKLTGGVSSSLKAIATTFTAGDVMELRATGTTTTTIALYRNGSLVDAVDDSSSPWTDGAPGITVYGQTVGIDNWEGGNLAAAGPGLIRLARVNGGFGPPMTGGVRR